MRSRWGPLLLGGIAISLLGAGVFITDPVSGYPPGTEPRPPYSWHGALHDGISVLAFLGWPAACFVFTRVFFRRGERGFAWYSLLTGLLFLGGFVLTSQGFAQVPGLVDIGGLLQRVTIVIGWTWTTLLALRLLRKAS